MLYELWEARDEGGDGFTFIPENHPQRSRLTRGSVLVWSVEADNWEEANQKRHEHMGWEPYKPLKD